MARKIEREILIHSEKPFVFQALLTPSKIRNWWKAVSAIVVPKKNGAYNLAWGPDEDHPEYIIISNIKEIVENRLLALTSIDHYYKFGDLPFHTDLESQFTLEREGLSTRLKLICKGFPEDRIADEFFKASCEGWDDALQSLKLYLEN